MNNILESITIYKDTNKKSSGFLYFNLNQPEISLRDYILYIFKEYYKSQGVMSIEYNLLKEYNCIITLYETDLPYLLSIVMSKTKISNIEIKYTFNNIQETVNLRQLYDINKLNGFVTTPFTHQKHLNILKCNNYSLDIELNNYSKALRIMR